MLFVNDNECFTNYLKKCSTRRVGAKTSLDIVSLVVMAAACISFLMEELPDFLKELYQGKLEREESHVWNALVMVSTDLAFPEHLELIRKAYEDDLADPGFEPLESVEERLETGEVDSHELEQYRLVDDVFDEMSWWACFSETEMRDDLPFTDDELPEEEDWDDPLQFPRLQNQTSFSGYCRKEPKIGRNDPCPCGSGKKYKKCCLR